MPTKPEFGKHRICSSCQAKESETLQIIDIILPPTIPRRQSICRPCLQVAIDSSIEKNRAKYREEYGP
jgi:hypothetical protein